MHIIAFNHYNNNYKMIDSLPAADNKISASADFQGVNASFVTLGDELGCVVQISSRDFKDDQKIEFIKAFQQGLKSRGMRIDATVCTDSDCTGTADFEQFNRGVKKIDHRITTIEAGLVSRTATADHHLTYDDGDDFSYGCEDFVTKFTSLLNSKPPQNFSVQETSRIVSEAYSEALQSVKKTTDIKRG